MKTLKNTVDGKNDQGTPKWIEVKVSHIYVVLMYDWWCLHSNFSTVVQFNYDLY